MSDEIVKYSNQFNNQALRKFTALDLDLLMAIASRVRDKGTDEVAFTFEELKRLAGLQRNMTNDEFAKQIANVNRRLLALNFEFQNEEHDIIQFALFAGFVTSPTKRTLTVSVNSRFSFLLNDLTSQSSWPSSRPCAPATPRSATGGSSSTDKPVCGRSALRTSADCSTYPNRIGRAKSTSMFLSRLRRSWDLC